jgi:predicted HD phosphohydrolase
VETVDFTRMDEGTAKDYALLDRALSNYQRDIQAKLPDAILKMLREQRGNTLGYRVDRFEHSLQTATRAFRDGADEETVAIALLHDVGDGIGLFNHSEVAAALLRPFVSERSAWIVQHHGLFQGYYYFHHVGRDRKERDQLRGHPYFEACANFCERWDQRAFDPAYDTMPLDAFEPIVRRLFSKPPRFLD